MKAGSKFLNAVSAVALTAGIVVTGAGVSMLAGVAIAEAAVVSRIDVRGNSRVDASTVRGNLTITPGSSFNNNDIDESVKRLFATGLFSDVQIMVSGSALVVTVSENQVINQVVFNGNKKIKDVALRGVVQSRQLGAYNDLIIQADVQAIRDAYAAIGRSDAVVTTRVVPVEGGRVNLAFEINEGDRTKISSINFVGNQAFGDGRLSDVITTKRSGFLSFLSRKDVYDEDKLRADEELLRRFYYNRGYADFRVISSFAELDETNNEYVVTITVEEGERYVFGDVSIESTVPGIDSDSLKGLVETRSGAVYSAKDVEDTILAISDRVATQGYPFATITPRGDRDYTNRTISVVYLVDEGSRAYVERIEIRGNTRTRDYVIRREFDLSEGDAFNQVLVRRAKKRLEDLKFFSSVDISTQPGSQPDRVVLIVDVKDQSTGEFGVGGGYSNNGGFSASVDITERNFLGRGQFIRASVGGGEDTREYNLSFTEPYFLGYRLAAGFDVFKTKDSSYTGFEDETQGINLRIGAPITEEIYLSTAFKYSDTSYSGVTLANIASLPERNAVARTVANGGHQIGALSYTLTYNTLDDQKLPREGISARFTQEYAGLGFDSDYLKTTAKASYFRMISEQADMIGQLSVGGGHILSTSNNLRVFDHLFIGQETIRGFDNRGIGPRVFSGATNVGAAGGTTYFNGSAEVSAPMPLVSRDLGLRFNVFADAATLYGNDISAADFGGQTLVGNNMDWRASVGVGITWASPFGPLRVYYAEPVVKENYDDVKKFGFGASTRF
ncbi:MAG: outer membrane protein assembly factor BamA [Hoeflea sp.]|uniref:outer membrane protein assembly factor BamA n=1 Tax=Hoeflea sp. TaxID=1940281 RepID=UPI001D733E6D|nr:outer membrane protein assembly factor BamA [Hoeflea sp.]MBU4529647.1 outer membrane protein assembly factor BamA [Alphaproteobacteria bacterium]MBU4546766.1 outer membrane protein assembly factor BamA [Alphaproteobacteria bacterium]MBU4551034.1 outer membrane protein assembly factor BamA [Alphaproteobacteria bacterium]MBV1723976.1 outer membrane protein assembly factor BamA [Hoeflea sp.]MBV1763253.1 outer membrane protein assembly factor BamA [Hoeflea sp.]